MIWSSVFSSLIAVTASGVILAQTTTRDLGNRDGAPRVPVLGYFSAGRTVQPILGVPGAVTVARDVRLPADFLHYYPAPAQQFGIAKRFGSAPVAVLWPGRARGQEIHAIEGALGQVDRVGFSPSGSTAVLYSAASAQAQVVTQLDSAPQVFASYDLRALESPLTTIGISDDARVVLVGASDGATGEVWMFTAGQTGKRLYSAGVPSAIRFFAGGHDAVVTDSGWKQALLLTNVTGPFNSRLLASEEQGVTIPSDIAIADDRQTIWIADRAAGLVSIELATGAVSVIDCPFEAGAFQALAGESTFLVVSRDGFSAGLWKPSTGAGMWLLTGSLRNRTMAIQ
jgi:hypothetical protein